jgi:TolA-binding protein
LRLVRRLPDWRELLIYAGGWLLLTAPFTAFLLYSYRWGGAGAAVSLWLVPQVMLLANCIPPRTIIPMYSKAVAMMKRGKYADAEWAVIQELEKCEDDYTGWMMLAELYATKFNDLPAAVQTISDLCEQPGTSPTQAAMALHRLADWQLQLAHDPAAARIVLGEISRKYPGTHLAFMAGQRSQQLPATREALLEQQQQAKKIVVPASQAIYEQAAQPDRPELNHDDAAELANHYSQRLTANPNDVPTREAFARLMAENLGQPAVGIEQLDLLLALPSPADTQKAAWLLLQAAWQLESLGDRAAGEKTLRRLVQEFPKSPQAFSAQRKLRRMEVETRSRQMRLTGGIRLPDLTEVLMPPSSAATPATASGVMAETPKTRE